MKPDISVIIPTFNEAASLKRTIETVKSLGKNIEIIVVDGESNDETRKVAEDCQVKVLQTERGRGNQLRAGAKISKGDVLWFLHADTIPSSGTVEQLQHALKDTRTVGGNFTIRFDGNSKAAIFLTWLYPFLRKIGLIYGDSAIFVRRETYQLIGGFKPLQLFEDLDLVYRLAKHGKLVNLSANVTTSSRRFENRSFWLTFVRWSIFQGLFWLGVNPNRLAKMYYPIRTPDKKD